MFCRHNVRDAVACWSAFEPASGKSVKFTWVKIILDKEEVKGYTLVERCIVTRATIVSDWSDDELVNQLLLSVNTDNYKREILYVSQSNIEVLVDHSVVTNSSDKNIK